MYRRRVVKRRPASLTEEEWLTCIVRGKLPRPGLVARDGDVYPPPDVYDLVMARELDVLRWRLETLCMALTKPLTSQSQNGSSSSGASPGQLLAVFSELWEFLAGKAYSDGTPRQTGQLSLKLSSAGVQVTLTDPTSGTYCCQTAMTLDDVLLALEIGLKEGSLAWRLSGYGKTKR